MIINYNSMASNALRQLNINQGQQAKSMAKLSSGLRINGAADDAAGLAISEKMKGQIRGLDQASRNAQDGQSLVQTAEGALSQTTDILQRMRELATQSANDTNTTSDRGNIQNEVDQLSKEIGRIGTTTQFNTQNLLDGSFKGTFQIGANQDQNMTVSINDMRSYNLGVTGKVTDVVDGTYTPGATVTGDTLNDGTYSVVTSGTNYNLTDSSGKTLATSTDGLTFTTLAADGNTGDDKLVFGQAVTSGSVTVSTDASGTTSYKGTAQFTNTGLQAGDYTFDAATKSLKDNNGTIVATSADGQTFKANVNGTSTTVFKTTAALTNTNDGEKISVGGIDVSSQSAANSAMTQLDKAIQSVSAERSKLGAVQNRLDYTTNNLNTSSQNISDAQSRIADVDMAKEMMNQSKSSVLAQAAQAMLAQANQQPQQVLQLLR